MHISQLETPVAVVDLDRLDANIAGFQNYLNEHGIANRPHIKTHKIPEIAHLQIRAGAVGITCQKLGEAEVMANAGIRDIFVPYNIIGEAKLERLMRLARRTRISLTADSEFVVGGLSSAAKQAGLTLSVLVECDTGYGRCGVQTPAAARELARTIVGSPGLTFGGLMTYPTCDTTSAFMRDAIALLAADGVPVERVSGGSTGAMWQAHHHPEITEHRAGMYAFGDRYTLRTGVMGIDACAFSVVTTVVSRPTHDRGIVDAGNKTLSAEVLALEGYGLIRDYPEARIYDLSEEHGLVDFSQCARRPKIGERLSVIPNISNAVVNLLDQIVGVRGEQIEVIWPVAARGRIQ